MLLALDLGNTELTVGAFAGDRLLAHWRLTASLPRTPDEWAGAVTAFLGHAGHSTQEVRAAVLASVAPQTTRGLTEGIQKATGVEPITIGPGSGLPVTLDVDDPLTVGADRIVNALAATERYRADVVVVDFGTATTFDCVTADRRFLGGVIMPGVRTAARELVRRTAMLPETELVAPPQVIGRRTETCIRAGLLYGAADAVDGIVRRIAAEWPGGIVPRVIATGGMADTIAPLTQTIEAVEPTLTLEGLRAAAGYLGASW